MTSRPSGTAIGFLLMSYLIVGMTGIFAASTAPLPLERAMARDQTLTAALATQTAPDPRAALEALRPALDDSADAVLAGPDPLPVRIERERIAMKSRFAAESDALSRRLQWMVGVATLTAALFGVALLGLGRG